VPSWMVCVSACVNLPLHHKVQKFSSGTGSPGWSRKKGSKMVVVVVCVWSSHSNSLSSDLHNISDTNTFKNGSGVLFIRTYR